MQPDRLANPFLAALPVTGVAVSTLGPLLGNETVAATDVIAARLDELQFDLGEGPCWDALATLRPVLKVEIRNPSQSEWPEFVRAIQQVNVHSIFAFPIAIGPWRIGAVDLYSTSPQTLKDEEVQNATILATLAGRNILRRALAEHVTDDTVDVNKFSRRLVHQATGMVLAQLSVDADDAALVIQTHAFTHQMSMMQVAEDIVERRLTFSVHENEIRDWR